MKSIKILWVLALISVFASCEQPTDQRALAAQYFELLFEKGDFEGIQKILAEDAIYTQAEGLPYGGTYTGFGEWMGMFGQVNELFALQIQGKPVLYLDENSGNVVGDFSVKFTSRKDSTELIMLIMESVKIEENKIVSVQPYYFDTKAISALAGIEE